VYLPIGLLQHRAMRPFRRSSVFKRKMAVWCGRVSTAPAFPVAVRSEPLVAWLLAVSLDMRSKKPAVRLKMQLTVKITSGNAPLLTMFHFSRAYRGLTACGSGERLVSTRFIRRRQCSLAHRRRLATGLNYLQKEGRDAISPKATI